MIVSPILFFIVCAFLLLFAAFGMARIALGPTAADRVVALDTINTLVVAVMIVLGAAYDQVVFVDVAIIYALVSFVGTLYIARYLEGGL
ncbi:MAG: monovalent cation/H+ antiporter complex subunit F [Candidatus Bipolaricaulota bacterium]|jgi:multicomponent Na+:H+ antiporter subunit F|nr:monovalent cation/H+ antiporter complex subunit F [Candidatus Bipolaricaulota bacterium]